MEVNKRARYNKFMPFVGNAVILFGIFWILGSFYLLYEDSDKFDSLARFLIIFFGPAFLISGIIIFFKGLGNSKILKNVRYIDKRCLGEVKQIFTVSESGERTHNEAIYEVNHTTYIVYGFTSKDGNKYLTEISGIKKSDNLKLGDQIQITYNPENPKQNFWAGEIE